MLLAYSVRANQSEMAHQELQNYVKILQNELRDAAMEAYRVSSDERLKSAEAEIKVSRSVLSFALKDTRSTIYCVSRCCDNTGRLNRFMYKMFNWVQVKIHKKYNRNWYRSLSSLQLFCSHSTL